MLEINSGVSNGTLIFLYAFSPHPFLAVLSPPSPLPPLPHMPSLLRSRFSSFPLVGFVTISSHQTVHVIALGFNVPSTAIDRNGVYCICAVCVRVCICVYVWAMRTGRATHSIVYNMPAIVDLVVFFVSVVWINVIIETDENSRLCAYGIQRTWQTRASFGRLSFLCVCTAHPFALEWIRWRQPGKCERASDINTLGVSNALTINCNFVEMRNENDAIIGKSSSALFIFSNPLTTLSKHIRVWICVCVWTVFSHHFLFARAAFPPQLFAERCHMRLLDADNAPAVVAHLSILASEEIVCQKCANLARIHICANNNMWRRQTMSVEKQSSQPNTTFVCDLVQLTTPVCRKNQINSKWNNKCRRLQHHRSGDCF